ncbi:MAG: transporter substrate-binding domain-containing protein [Pseudomonadota bacterium]
MQRVITAFAPLLALLLTLLPLPGAAGVLEEVVERGTLRVGVSTFVPWTFRSVDGTLEGHEIDIVERIAGDIGVEAELVEVPFSEIMDRLNAGEFDMIAAGMAITPARAMQIGFTQPYFFSGITLATNKSATADLESLADVNSAEIKIAVVAETFSASLGARLFDEAEIVAFDTADAAQAAVLSGEAPIYLASEPEANFFALENPDAIDVPLSEPLVRSSAGFGVRKDAHEWREFLNAWIVAREADLFLSSTYDFWFESIEWTARVGETDQ